MGSSRTEETVLDLALLRKVLGTSLDAYAAFTDVAAHDGTIALTLAELAQRTGMTSQNVSRHLAKLRAQGLLLNPADVNSRGAGRWIRLRRLLPLAYAKCFQTPRSVSKPPLTDSFITYKSNGDRVTHNPKGLSDSGVCKRSSAAAAPLRSKRLGATREPGEGVALMTRTNEENEIDPTLVLERAPVPRHVDAAHLPPYPAASRYPTIKYPRMPRLTGDKSGDARLLVRAYKAVVLHKYGRKPRVDKQAHFRMRTAAAAMHKHGIESPFAWAWFRAVCWSMSEKSSKKPSIDYVFSAKVIEQHAAQFKRKQSAYDVLRRVRITPSHARLLVLWESARRAAMSKKIGSPGEEGTRRAVSAILPDGLYRELASKIEEERATAEAELYRRLAQGEWIW